MKKLDAGVIGIHQVNSVDFVKAAFRVYNSGDVLAILKQPDSGLSLKQEIHPAPGGGWLDLKQEVIQENRPAQIVFTSGTEGAPKAILLSHQALADVVVRLNAIMKVDESIREYVGIPVTYSFGLGRCRAVAAAGGRSFIPEKGFNPAELARMLTAGEINAISAVPTLWRTLLAQPEIIGTQGRKVKWIEIGSQYMSQPEKEQMKALFPNAVIVQHYGLTEASRTTFLNISETRGERLESVGRAYGQVEVKVSPEGRIMIRGPHVAMGRVLDGEVLPITDSEGWYTTSDSGHMEGEYTYYDGRADDLINCGGVKVSPDALQEKVSLRIKAGNNMAICRINDPLRGEGFFVAVEAGAGLDRMAVEEAVHAELLVLGVNARFSIKVQEVASIPRTDTGKVQRKLLASLYTADVGAAPARAPSEEGRVADLFKSVFPRAEIKSSDSFRSLGGDSLNYVQMSMLLEKRFASVPPDWEQIPIAELERLDTGGSTPFLHWIDTSIFLRVLAILGVVATHSGGSVLGGGTLLLVALIGYNMARFKSADFLESGMWRWLRTYVAIILIPYYLVTVLDQVWMRKFDLDQWLLYANLVSAKITLVFPFWFVQVLLQCLILLAVLFSFPQVRKQFVESTFGFSMLVLAVLVTLRAIYPLFWDTTYLNHLVPLRFLAILWLGWCFYYAKTISQRSMLFVAGAGFALLDNYFATNPSWWLLVGCTFLAFVPRVPVPAIMSRLINDIGAATFYIFIFNGLVLLMQRKIVQVDSLSLVFLISLSGSMAFWWLIERSGWGRKLVSLLESRR